MVMEAEVSGRQKQDALAQAAELLGDSTAAARHVLSELWDLAFARARSSLISSDHGISGRGWCWPGAGARAGQGLVDLAGDVALEAADDLSGCLALAGAPGHVGLGARVGGHPDEDDSPEGGGGLPVSGLVEAVAALLAGGGVDGAGAA
jgi:hypothetical protein